MNKHINRNRAADANFSSAAKNALKQKFDPSPKTSMEVLQAKAKTLAMTLHNHIKPIVQAGGALDDAGKRSLEATIFTMFVQGFDSKMFTKDELIHLCAMMSTEAMMESIDADPGGKGAPDILSGL